MIYSKESVVEKYPGLTVASNIDIDSQVYIGSDVSAGSIM